MQISAKDLDFMNVFESCPYLAMTKRTQLTPRQASKTYIQISGESGFRKEKTPGFVPLGLWYRMEIPRVMNGLEKSITFSLT